MNNRQLAGYAVVAAMFGLMGALAGIGHKAPAGPVATAIAPTGGAPHTAVVHLLAQTLNDAAGKPRPLSQWRGKALLVNFWAPWCAPCVREMPALSALAAREAARPGGGRFNLIGIGIDSPANIAGFAARFKIGYPLYVAGMSGTDLSREFGDSAGALPYTVLIGADGQVRKTWLGGLKFDQLQTDLDRL